MPPGAAAPVFPSASPTRACQSSSAATARLDTPVRTAESANCRAWNFMVVLSLTYRGCAKFGRLRSIELLGHLLYCRSLQQGHLGHRVTVLQLRIDADCPGP